MYLPRRRPLPFRLRAPLSRRLARIWGGRASCYLLRQRKPAGNFAEEISNLVGKHVPRRFGGADRRECYTERRTYFSMEDVECPPCSSSEGQVTLGVMLPARFANRASKL